MCKFSKTKVYRGEQDGTKRQVAVKVIQKKLIDHDTYLKAALFTQIQILQLLKSQNVVRVLDVMQSSHNYYIIQDVCQSDLEKLLKQKQIIEQKQAIIILRQLCNGFMTLVRQGVIHRYIFPLFRDLKPANILISKGVIKIGDFGFAKKNVTKRMKNASAVGTPLYMALQVLKSQSYTSKCDIWGVGFIFYEMLHGKTPWTAKTQFQLVKNIQTKPLIINENLSAVTKDFLKGCLKVQQKDRFSWDDVFTHPIFDGYFDQYAQQNKMFEDKLKMVMGQLRFNINSKNLDLNKLLSAIGCKNNKQLDYNEFSDFIKHIHPMITKQQIQFFFQKMDLDSDGAISLTQIAKQMQKHGIKFNRDIQTLELLQTKNTFTMNKTNSMQQDFKQKSISNQLQLKVRKCFLKLYKILTTKKLTLYKTFSAYDSDKSQCLNLLQFQKILKRLDITFTSEQIQAIFQFIDEDHSKTIQFSQLNRYYCKVNGIPQNLEKYPEFKTQKQI